VGLQKSNEYSIKQITLKQQQKKYNVHKALILKYDDKVLKL
jgi:hypothetical protein